MFFLDLCGPIYREDHCYKARFQPEAYLPYVQNIKNNKSIPGYVLVESLAQISCRSSSQQFFSSDRTIPVQIKNLTHYRAVSSNEQLFLTANLTVLKDFVCSDCKVENADGDVVMSAQFIVTPLKL